MILFDVLIIEMKQTQIKFHKPRNVFPFFKNEYVEKRIRTNIMELKVKRTQTTYLLLSKKLLDIIIFPHLNFLQFQRNKFFPAALRKSIIILSTVFKYLLLLLFFVLLASSVLWKVIISKLNSFLSH